MANSNDQRILELAEKAMPHDGPGPWDEYVKYLHIAVNCAPDLVRRIATLRDVLEEVFQQRAGKEAIAAALRADDALCAAMKVGDE